jgi:hypothetical protein
MTSSYRGSLNSRVVLRGNVFEGGGGVAIGIKQPDDKPGKTSAQTDGNVLVDSNVLTDHACNITTRPMPAGADINDYLVCGENCSVYDVVLHGNQLGTAKSCP